MKPSTWTLPSGHNGVMFWCKKPFSVVNESNAGPWKGGPLSVLRTSCIPWVAKIRSSAGMVFFAAVLEMTSTSRYFE